MYFCLSYFFAQTIVLRIVHFFKKKKKNCSHIKSELEQPNKI